MAPAFAGANERMLLGFPNAAPVPYIEAVFPSLQTPWMVDCSIKMFIATTYFIDILQYFPHLSVFLDFNIDRDFYLHGIIFSF